MDDRQILEEHSLGRRRLVSSMVHGSSWRRRRRRGAVRPVLGGLALAVLVAVGFGVAAYVGDQLDKQRREQQQRLRGPSVTSSVPVAPPARP